MKKLLSLLLIAVLSMTLTSCLEFRFDPRIIGTGSLQYDTGKNVAFVVVGENQYIISAVAIPNNDMKSHTFVKNLQFIEGVQITLFTAPALDGVQAVAGHPSVEQIKDVYGEDIGLIKLIGDRVVLFFWLSLAFVLFVIVLIWLFKPDKGKKKGKS